MCFYIKILVEIHFYIQKWRIYVMKIIKPSKINRSIIGFSINISYITSDEIKNKSENYKSIIDTLRDIDFGVNNIEIVEKELLEYFKTGFTIGIIFCEDKETKNVYINEMFINDPNHFWFNELFKTMTFEYTNCHCFVSNNKSCKLYIGFYDQSKIIKVL